VSKSRKAEVLLEEAKIDLENKCFNKAVSASYFAVRLLAESFLPALMTTKDDKIANALFREVERRSGKEKAYYIRSEFLYLFNERKKADHRPDLFKEEEARGIVRRAEFLFNEIREILSRSDSA